MKTLESQTKIVEKDLKARRVVTTWQAITEHNITRVGARIHELKKRMSIDTKMVKKDGRRYAEYRLQR